MPVRPTASLPSLSPAQKAETTSASSLRPATFKPSGKLDLPLEEASDVVALPGGAFLAVSDTSDSALLRSADGKFTELKLEGIKNGRSGLEGVAYDPARRTLLVAREEKGELLRYELGATNRPRLAERIALDLGGSKNKGIEGLAFLPAKFSPSGKDGLIAAKEGEPKLLVLVGPDGRGKPVNIELDKSLTAALKDFSAIAVDPKTGHLFIASDESAAFAEVALVNVDGKLSTKFLGVTTLRDDKGRKLDRVEGLTFDEKGDLFVLPENAEALYSFKRDV